MARDGIGAEARIRCYRSEDAGEVARLFAESAALDPTLDSISLEEWRAFTRESFNRRARDFRVARLRKKAVAVLTSTLLAEQDPPARHFRIVVHPDARRGGIGTLLLEQAEEQGPPGAVLQCNCSDSWRPGREFLKHHGFEVARRHLEMELRGAPPEPPAPPAGYAVRPHAGTASDDVAWLRLDHEGYAEDPDAQRPIVEDLAGRRADPAFVFRFLERDGSRIGFVHASGGSLARIHSLVVAPPFRGRGLGRLLMLHAIGALRRGRATIVTLGVRSENVRAVELYRELGFGVVTKLETWRRPVRRA